MQKGALKLLFHLLCVSDSAWSFITFLLMPNESTDSWLHFLCVALFVVMESSFQVFSTNLFTSTSIFTFQNLSSHYVAGIYLVFLCCTCWEYCNDLQLLDNSHITIQQHSPVLRISKEHIILDCITYHSHKDNM